MEGGRGAASQGVCDQCRMGKAEREVGVRAEMGVRREWMCGVEMRVGILVVVEDLSTESGVGVGGMVCSVILLKIRSASGWVIDFLFGSRHWVVVRSGKNNHEVDL
jgi:hypothetical protein